MSTDETKIVPIDYKHLSPTERDFLEILPEKFRIAAWSLYKDYRKLACFTSVFERSKMCSSWMSGFVTATHLTQNSPEPEPEAGRIVPISGAQ